MNFDLECSALINDTPSAVRIECRDNLLKYRLLPGGMWLDIVPRDLLGMNLEFAEYQPVVLLRNKAECKKCHDVVESKSRHDFIWCKCRSIFLDGGNDYWRCGGEDLANILRLYELRNLTAQNVRVGSYFLKVY